MRASPRQLRSDRIRLGRPIALLALSAALLASCAPDAVRTVEATGFNAYLRQLGEVCRPLRIGNAEVGDWIRTHATSSDDYAYFMDVTSKLYFRRLSPEGYRQAVVGFFGPGSSNESSFDCIFRNLPPDRPAAPPGTY
jgi:hypothetical protein